jgi:hypothetical protein
MWLDPSRLPHDFFAAPQVGPPFTPPLAPLPLPRVSPPQLRSWTLGSGEWYPQYLVDSFSTMELTPHARHRLGGRLRRLQPHHLILSSISSPRSSSAFHPCLIIVDNGSIVPVTSVGDSVLPGPFYLNDVLVAPDLVQSLLYVCYFIVRYNSSAQLYTILLLASATSITDAPPYALAAAASTST